MPILVNRLVRSKRRTIALIVERDGSVTVRAPLRMSAKLIDEFVEKHANWVEKKRVEVRSLQSEQTREYQAGEQFLFLGRSHALEIVSNTNKKLELADSFRLSESEQHNAAAIFRSWYRKQAARIIGERVAHFAKQFGLDVSNIRITSARTRWGSCSAKGTLSFSWRLLMTPPDVIDYVVVHELAHTIHHNHSKRFWKLVERWMPDYKERKRLLKQYGQEII